MFIYFIINVIKQIRIEMNHIHFYPDQIKNKKTAINPINKKENKWFQYAVTVALNDEEIGKHSERITNIKSFVNKYNWKGINFPSEKR